MSLVALVTVIKQQRSQFTLRNRIGYHTHFLYDTFITSLQVTSAIGSSTPGGCKRQGFAGHCPWSWVRQYPLSEIWAAACRLSQVSHVMVDLLRKLLSRTFAAVAWKCSVTHRNFPQSFSKMFLPPTATSRLQFGGIPHASSQIYVEVLPRGDRGVFWQRVATAQVRKALLSYLLDQLPQASLLMVGLQLCSRWKFEQPSWARCCHATGKRTVLAGWIEPW